MVGEGAGCGNRTSGAPHVFKESFRCGDAGDGKRRLTVDVRDANRAACAEERKIDSDGVEVDIIIRGEHGMSHSVYISDPNGYGIEVLYDLPREMWEDEIDEAFAYFKNLPTEGPGALEDSTEAPALRTNG